MRFVLLLAFFAGSAPRTKSLLFNIIRQCEPAAPCRRCEGDCKRDDSACLPGLECFRRNGDEDIPGCEGQGKTGVDYCFLPVEVRESKEKQSDRLVNNGRCDQFSPCGRCEGSCYDDIQCLPGLKCFSHEKKRDVPGCNGKRARRVGYCFDPEDELSGGDDEVNGECSRDSPCKKCQGHCKNDSWCARGLICFKRMSDENVPGCEEIDGHSGESICYSPDDAEKTEIDCSSNSPCGKCEGNCNNDSGCSGELKCLKRSQIKDIPGCEGINGSKNICYDPDDAVDEPNFSTESPSPDLNAIDTHFPEQAASLSPKIPTLMPTKQPSPSSAPHHRPNALPPPTKHRPNPSTEKPTLSQPSLSATQAFSAGPSHMYTPTDATVETHSSFYASKRPSVESTSRPQSNDSSTMEPVATPSRPSNESSSDMYDMEVIPLSPMTLNLVFLSWRRTTARNGEKITSFEADESNLSFVIMNVLIRAFGDEFSSFEVVVLEIQFDDEVMSNNMAILSYRLNGNVYLRREPELRLPSQTELDDVSLQVLNDGDFVGILQQSNDPVLASLHSAEVYSFVPAERGNEGALGIGSQSVEKKSENSSVVIIVPVVIALTIALVAVIASYRKRYRQKEQRKPVETENSVEHEERKKVICHDKSRVSSTVVETSALSAKIRTSDAPKRLLSGLQSLSIKKDVASTSHSFVGADHSRIRSIPPDMGESNCGKSSSHRSIQLTSQKMAPDFITNPKAFGSNENLCPKNVEDACIENPFPEPAEICNDGQSVSSSVTWSTSMVAPARVQNADNCDEDTAVAGTVVRVDESALDEDGAIQGGGKAGIPSDTTETISAWRRKHIEVTHAQDTNAIFGDPRNVEYNELTLQVDESNLNTFGIQTEYVKSASHVRDPVDAMHNRNVILKAP